MSTRASPGPAPWPTSTSRSGPAATSSSWARSSTTCWSTSATSRSTWSATPTPRRSSTSGSRTPRTPTACSAAGTRSGGPTTTPPGSTPGPSTPTTPRASTRARPASTTAASGRRWTRPTRPGPTRPCSTRTVSSSCCASTSAATPPSSSRRSAACPRSCSCRSPRRCAPTRGESEPAPSAMRSAGPSTPSECSTSAPRPSSSCCWVTSAGPAVGSWPCAATPPSRAPPTSPPSTTCCPATSRCRTPNCTRASRSKYVELNSSPTGYWGGMRGYLVSLLKAWWGAAATAGNQFCFDYLPRINQDHSTYQTTLAMLEGRVEGFFVLGENPAVGSANSGLHRKAMAKLDWLVVRDFVETETAAFWYDAPEIETGELRTKEIPTEVFLLPAAAHTEKDGSFTNTQRLLQWHHQAVEPPGDSRSELWFMYHLGRIIREKLAGSTAERDRPVLDLTWDYPTTGTIGEPSADAVLREIGGWDAEGTALSSYLQLADDGSTVCGCWIYCGCYAEEVNQPARRMPGAEQTWVAPEWGWAWPDNRRLLYNRASADPDGKPWSERKRYIWWDAEQGQWTGHDTPDFKKDKPPDYQPPEDATGGEALRGDEPFIMQADGLGWLYVPSGLRDGPFPTHYEPHESPFTNPLYRQQANPARQRFERPGNRSHPSDGDAGAAIYPYVLTTY